MNNNIPRNRVIVLDMYGNRKHPMHLKRAIKMIANNEAKYVCDNPTTIQLLREVKKNGDANE